MRSEGHNKGERLPITVVILTKNEEKTVCDAIASVLDDFAEVVVLDSFSTDRTEECARSAGANVVKNEFKGYASQRNFALREMPRATDWVFFLDADERISKELTAELRRDFLRLSETCRLLYVRRKDMFEGRWIKRSSGYPTWFGRLCHAPSVTVRREINEEFHCQGATERLKEHLLHFPFQRGLSHWLERHNSYSSLEAATKVEGEKADVRLLFTGDPGLRRRGLKQIYMRLPFRPLVGFLYLYVFKGGFLDGRPGLRYALLRAFYELMISIKLDEIRAAKIRDVSIKKDRR
ncbi:glycosyltransferase family 2 protein [Oceanomicrobium pacificus]|uniref:Glycosyltransferase n=1 Tax=Oceanomicrobium pacificus TaxID=2692916 RepID=A0A6B0TT88_9RHOB|nr:glycosyltransferase family 2 protein [Oceanomicrobium pacificus]MXU65015.1 glycosyltransferase [Oceanomicrobium pacificus]